MTTARSDAAALAVQLEDVWVSLEALGRQLLPAEWGVPTRCPGWDVTAQYAHVLGVESLLASVPAPPPAAPAPHVRNAIGETNEAWVAAWAGRPPGELLDELASVTATRLGALRAMDEAAMDAPSWTPVGQATYRRFMQIRVFDCWVHEQDVRAALDRPGHSDGPAAEQAIDEIERNLGYIVGKRAAVPPASLVEIVLRGPVVRTMWVEVPPEGRASVVGEPGRQADVTLRLDSGTFAALACGRSMPSPPSVTVEGDTALGARIVEHLAFTI
jgi:uncharacterized protein (TIGR03083 family)